MASVVQVSEDHQLRWGSYVSQIENLDDAIRDCVINTLRHIGRDSVPELAIVFVGSAHGKDFGKVVPILRALVPSLKHIFGCTVSFLA